MASRPTRFRFDVRRFRFTCVSEKVCYDTRAEAEDARESAMHDGQVRPGCHLEAYRCDDCTRWHLANRVVVFRDRPSQIGPRNEDGDGDE